MKRRCVLKGFTLIELLVVIAVLALLLSILMPSLAKAKELARRTVCLSRMSQLGLICVTYAHENDDWFPDYNVYPGPSGHKYFQSGDMRCVFDGVWNADARPIWVGYVADYTVEKSTDIFYCPSETIVTRENVWPTNSADGSYWTGYAFWGNFKWCNGSPLENEWGSILDPARKTTTVKTSAIIPLWGDFIEYANDVVPTPWNVTHSRYGRGYAFMAAEALGMNSTYADGSARWCKYESGKSDEFSAALQWRGTNIRFWGAPRTFEKEGYGLPEDLPKFPTY